MSHDPRSASAEPGVTNLISGIISDMGDLVRQEIRFAKAEVKSDFGKTKQAVTALAIGVGAASVSGLLLLWMLVHLLHWLTTPESARAALDPATLPLWACFGIVGGAIGAVAAFLVAGAIAKFRSFNPLPDETAKSLEENVKWIANANSK